jgi:hypothetical protein
VAELSSVRCKYYRHVAELSSVWCSVIGMWRNLVLSGVDVISV